MQIFPSVCWQCLLSEVVYPTVAMHLLSGVLYPPAVVHVIRGSVPTMAVCMLSDVVYQQWQCACYHMYCANIGSVPVTGCPVHISGTVPTMSVHKLPDVRYQHVTGCIVPTCYQMYCTNMLPDVV